MENACYEIEMCNISSFKDSIVIKHRLMIMIFANDKLMISDDSQLILKVHISCQIIL